MVRRRKTQSKVQKPSGVVVCLMRVGFFVMMILLLVLVLVTAVYYILDLALQSGCRTVHDDQPYLINLASGNLDVDFQVEIFIVLYREIDRGKYHIWESFSNEHDDQQFY